MSLEEQVRDMENLRYYKSGKEEIYALEDMKAKAISEIIGLITDILQLRDEWKICIAGNVISGFAQVFRTTVHEFGNNVKRIKNEEFCLHHDEEYFECISKALAEEIKNVLDDYLKNERAYKEDIGARIDKIQAELMHRLFEGFRREGEGE